METGGSSSSWTESPVRRSVHALERLAGRGDDYERSALLRRNGDHRLSGGELGFGARHAFSAKDGNEVWTLYTIPGRARPVTRRGRRTASRGFTAAPPSGRRRPSIRAWNPVLFDGQRRTGLHGAVRAGDNLFSASIVALDVKTAIPVALPAGAPRHLGLRRSLPRRALRPRGRRKAAAARLRRPGKTGWVYILDRTDGEPIIGIDERAVRRSRAAHRRDAAVSDRRRSAAVSDIAPIGFTLINQGRIFTPFVGDKGLIAAPSLLGGVNWPPSSYDPVRQTLFVCANASVGKFIGGDRDFEIPAPGKRYEGGVSAFADLPATGIFASMDLRTNRIVWRNRWRDRCWAGSVATAGGLVFVGRNDGRLMSLDADTGLPLWNSDRRRDERAVQRLRAQRQPVRRRTVGRQRAFENGARRQRVAVRFAGYAEGDGAGRYGGGCGCARVDNGRGAGRSQARRRGLSTDVRRLPRRQRGGGPRRPVAEPSP